MLKLNMDNINNKGITLIALVITIIVLLILAGVSILTLTGQNGLLSKGNTAVMETSHSQVREGVILKNAENITENKTEGKSTTIVEFLQANGVIGKTAEAEGKYIINTEKLLGNKMSLGNGSYEDGKFKDVYVLEEYTGEVESGNKEGTKLATTEITKIAESGDSEVKYKVMYYDKNSEPTEVLDLGDAQKGTDSLNPSEPEDTNTKKITIKTKDQVGNAVPNVEFAVYEDEDCTSVFNGQSNVKTGTDGTCEIGIPQTGNCYIRITKSGNSSYDCQVTELSAGSMQSGTTKEIELENIMHNGPVEVNLSTKGSLTTSFSDMNEGTDAKGNYKLYKMGEWKATTDNKLEISYDASYLYIGGDSEDFYKIICDNESSVKVEEKAFDSLQEKCTFENLTPGVYTMFGTAQNNFHKYRTFLIFSVPLIQNFDGEKEVLYDITNSIQWERDYDY